MSGEALSSLDFFQQLQAHFSQIWSGLRHRSELLDTLLLRAWQSFDVNVASQCEGLPELDCHKGCATCCTLRVTATAPEVFMLARFIRAVTPGLKKHGVDLQAQIAKANGMTCGVGEAGRVAMEDESLGARWLAGEDVLKAAQVEEVSAQEVARTFDLLKVAEA